MLLEILGSCTVIGAIGAALGAVGTYFILNINGTSKACLAPNESYSDTISLGEAKSQIGLYQSTIQKSNIDSTTHGRRYKFSELLAFLGRTAAVAQNGGKTTDDISINAYFALDNNNKMNIIFVPCLPNDNTIVNPSNVDDFIYLNSSGISTTTIPTPTTLVVDLLDRGGMIPPPPYGTSILSM